MSSEIPDVDEEGLLCKSIEESERLRRRQSRKIREDLIYNIINSDEAEASNLNSNAYSPGFI